MPKKNVATTRQTTISAQPRINQHAAEIQAYGTVSHMLPLDLEEPVRLEMTERLNQLLADSITLRDLYKKSHWQVAGPTFYQLHLLFDKHFDEQVELVDAIAERIQLLGGVSIAMAADVAETTQIERPPRGREEVPVRAAKLVGVLAGERPVRGTCPVAPVVIPGGGKGDQSVESPGVKVPVGWVKTWSAPTGGRANRQVVARANRGQAPKISPPRESEGGGRRKCRDRERWSKASVVGKGTGCMQPTNFPWSQRATCR